MPTDKELIRFLASISLLIVLKLFAHERDVVTEMEMGLHRAQGMETWNWCRRASQTPVPHDPRERAFGRRITVTMCSWIVIVLDTLLSCVLMRLALF